MFNSLEEYETYLENYIHMVNPLVLTAYIMEVIDQDSNSDIHRKFHVQLIDDLIQEALDKGTINAQTLLFYGETIMSEDYGNSELFNLSKSGFLDPDLYNFDYEVIDTVMYKGKKLVSLATKEFKDRVGEQAKLDLIKLYLDKCSSLAEEIFE